MDTRTQAGGRVHSGAAPRRLAALLHRKLTRLRALGVADASRWGLVTAEGRFWERYFRVETGRPYDPAAYAGLADAIHYEPLPWHLLRRTMDALRLSAHDAFLDYGSGMGRALLMAAKNQLRRVVGVELMAPLAVVARENLAAARPRLKSPVELVVGDAATFEVPDDITVAYLFNPFVGEVMRAAQEQLAASLRRRPRPLKILYAHASDQRDLFAGVPWLKLTERVEVGVFRGMNIGIYTN